jgi:hypothetical protein
MERRRSEEITLREGLGLRSAEESFRYVRFVEGICEVERGVLMVLHYSAGCGRARKCEGLWKGTARGG